MEINSNKTVTVNFTRSDKSHPNISFGHTINYIDQQQSHCPFGLILQSNSCWSEHILKLIDKACQQLKTIRTFFFFLL